MGRLCWIGLSRVVGKVVKIFQVKWSWCSQIGESRLLLNLLNFCLGDLFMVPRFQVWESYFCFAFMCLLIFPLARNWWASFFLAFNQLSFKHLCIHTSCFSLNFRYLAHLHFQGLPTYLFGKVSKARDGVVKGLVRFGKFIRVWFGLFRFGKVVAIYIWQ